MCCFFVVVAEHTAENCPGGLVRPDEDFLANVAERVEHSGITLVEAYSDAAYSDAGHVWFLVVEAHENEALHTALEPFWRIESVNVHSVLRLSDATAGGRI